MAAKNIAPGAARLRWLADAPMFIDAQQIGAFADLAAWHAEPQIVRERLQQILGIRLDASLEALFPWLSADCCGEAAGTTTLSHYDTQNIVVRPAVSPARQLVKLALHYLLNQPERICFPDGKETRLPTHNVILESPRMIAFIDTEPGTKFLPLAAELGDGRVVRFSGQLIGQLQQKNYQSPGPYPENAWIRGDTRRVEKYWDWFATFWHTDNIAGVLEDALAMTGRPPVG